MYINCFGQLEVVTPNGILREEDFNADLSYTIFLYLVINHNKHANVQDLVDSIWEGMTLDASYKQAKNAVYRSILLIELLIIFLTMIAGRKWCK